MDYLVDTSVWARTRQEGVRRRLIELASLDVVWICRAIDLEVVYSSTGKSVAEVVSGRRQMRDVQLTPTIMERALEVADMMASAGLHRHAKPMDLVVAAAAESAGLTVLHYDRDYDHIASVTGQTVEWVAEAGSLD